MKSVSLFFLAATLTLVEGCAVGPRYAKPSVPMAPADTFKELNGWKTAQPSDQMNRGNWWEIFGDPQLNSLEEQVTVSNQDLKVAEARFREARAVVRFNRSTEFPTISTGPGISAVRDSAHRPYLPSTHNTFRSFL
jgi:outer membrane protein TolC